MDAHKNFAYSTVATAPSPATSGTTLVVASGQGALFPAVPFNATVWPTGAQPTAATAEIVRVTGISSDTLTIVRAQEGSSARTVIVGDQISATITAKTITDAENGFDPATRSCQLYTESNLDVQRSVNTWFPWASMYDNTIDENQIFTIPAHLGLSFAFDGSDTSGIFTTTEAGIWSYSLSVYVPQDATAKFYGGVQGADIIDFYQMDCTATTWANFNGVAPLQAQGCLELPSGASFRMFLKQLTLATANPWTIAAENAQLGLIRLA